MTKNTTSSNSIRALYMAMVLFGCSAAACRTCEGLGASFEQCKALGYHVP